VIIVFIILIIIRFRVTIKDYSKTTILFYFNNLKRSNKTVISNSNKTYKIIIKTN
jgi:hypothetical protein